MIMENSISSGSQELQKASAPQCHKGAGFISTDSVWYGSTKVVSGQVKGDPALLNAIQMASIEQQALLRDIVSMKTLTPLLPYDF